MSKKCFSSCRFKLPCSRPLCKRAAGEIRTFCRVDGTKYKLNNECDIISKTSGQMINKTQSQKNSKKIFKKNITQKNSKKNKTEKHHNISVKSSSYRPSINKHLVSLKSLDREEEINLCNLKDYQLNIYTKPLLINIDGKCISVFKDKAKKYLLKQLQSSKHLNMSKVYAPLQDKSNCWFNSMFILFFISDKGRQFFHYFRTLMIIGKLPNGDKIPLKLRNGFALLNYYIETCLSGLDEGKIYMNTNEIIKYIYYYIGQSVNYIYKYNQHGNPLYYYEALVNYMSLKSINIFSLRTHSFTSIPVNINTLFNFGNNPPHIICIHYGDDNNYKHKTLELEFDRYKYKLDSCCIRNVAKYHFTALLTCNGEDFGFDGASQTRLLPMKWKDKLNSSISFKFDTSSTYNFTTSYQMLFYYRIK